MEDGANVTLDGYEFPWHNGTGTGAVAGTWTPAGDWMCAVNPAIGQESNPRTWRHAPGMCLDS